jgi:hypothetical protein
MNAAAVVRAWTLSKYWCEFAARAARRSSTAARRTIVDTSTAATAARATRRASRMRAISGVGKVVGTTRRTMLSTALGGLPRRRR